MSNDASRVGNPLRANARANTPTHAPGCARGPMLCPHHSPTPPATTPPRGYARAGHAKKLEPIIQSLDYYDHDPEAWQSLKASVERMTDGWNDILRQVSHDSNVYVALSAQRDLCVEALRVQSAMFREHRLTCARALKLQEVV